MDWTRIVMIVIAALVGIGIGRLRREPLSVTALNVGGFVISIVSLFWAIALGPEASFAALGTSLGAILFTMGWARGRAAQRSTHNA